MTCAFGHHIAISPRIPHDWPDAIGNNRRRPGVEGSHAPDPAPESATDSLVEQVSGHGNATATPYTSPPFLIPGLVNLWLLREF